MEQLQSIREQFPITKDEFIASDGARRRIVYMDHGASTHPPTIVLDQYRDFLQHHYANIHRGNHYLSQHASELYDGVAETVLRFIGAEPEGNEVVFTVNTTGAIDVVSYMMKDIEGVTLVSGLEHHSNDLPHRRSGETARIGLLDDGTLDYNDLEEKLREHTVKLVAVTGASNVTGYMPDIHRIARMAHAHGALILVDGAQLLAHSRIDLRPNDAEDHIDCFAAAGHKAYAPFGAAFLVAPRDLCNSVNPYIPGGGTVKFVTNDDVYFTEGPDRVVGGTPNIAGVIAMARALEWLESIGIENIRRHELELLRYALNELRKIDRVILLGNIPAEERLGVISFNIEGYFHADVARLLNDRFGVATRNGCFCAHPYLLHLLKCGNTDSIREGLVRGDASVKVPGAVRATIGIYNDRSDIDALLEGIRTLAAEADELDEAFDVAKQCADDGVEA